MNEAEKGGHLNAWCREEMYTHDTLPRYNRRSMVSDGLKASNETLTSNCIPYLDTSGRGV